MMSEPKLTYSSAISELEEIVAKMQSPQCEVDQLCDLTRRATVLLRFCRTKLTETDQDLVKLLDNID
ncbi:MAG: exodeoxyribonuclease VII small subunit [Bacteroidales bacterium]|nr:exodeoxyribonuclease VII small subunit [Bacteroidales bacterium]